MAKLPDLPKGKFDGVDTVDMFELIKLPTQRAGGSGEKARAPKVAGSGQCPTCLAKVGAIVDGEHLVWRKHNRPLGKSAQQACESSGKRLCDVPPVPVAEASVAISKQPECTCLIRRRGLPT